MSEPLDPTLELAKQIVNSGPFIPNWNDPHCATPIKIRLVSITAKPLKDAAKYAVECVWEKLATR
jgi:hypothetical protein